MNTIDEAACRAALEKVLEDSKCGVVPKSHLEHIEQLLGAPTVRKTDWHERGGYPPVGSEFEFSLDGKEWSKRVMLFNDYTSFLICSSKQPSRRWHYVCGNVSVRFRPTQTERERLTEKALGMTRDTNSVTEAVCILRDANMLKMPEEKPE